MKPARVLHESALPGDGHSQEQGIEPRVVESFTDVAAGGEDESRLVLRDGCQGHECRAPLGWRHASTENDKVASDPSKEVGKVFQVVLAFGEQDRRAPFGQRARDVSQDEPVAVLVSRQCRVERLDPIEGFLATGAKHRLADHQAVIERPPSRIAAGVNRKAHRAKLHLGDRVKTIPPTGRGRQAGQEACLHLRQHPLEGHGGDVVTLIDNYVAVGRHQIVDAVQPDETLDHRHVQAAVGGVLAGANLADGFGREPEEHG